MPAIAGTALPASRTFPQSKPVFFLYISAINAVGDKINNDARVGDRVALSSTVLVCNTPVRFHLRRLLEPFIPRIVVLSPAEIPSSVAVQSLGVVQ